MTPQAQQIIPSLRSDIEFHADKQNANGPVMWVIHDPLQHRYFQIDDDTKRILSVWRNGDTFGQLQDTVKNDLGIVVDEAKLAKLAEFLGNTNLSYDEQHDAWKELHQRNEAARLPFLKRLVLGHLYFRIPLVHPHRFLVAAQAAVEPLFSRKFFALIILAGLTGLYLVSRQWDAFTASFDRAFSINGAVYFALALPLIKIAHELGHAFTALRFGCRVSTMGIAFMMMFPVLYTDVSDSWRISDRRQRMLISAAGMIVELAMAMIATFIWAFLDNGIFRDIVFALATTGWVMSLGVNLNPCMKFDGYYLFSDWLKIDNLQSRAFAFGRWKVRRALIAPDLPEPEPMPSGTRTVLIAYAFATWIYRLVLFTTIALLAYHFAFKLLGIVLFALEIWLLILKPVFRELAEWREIGPSLVSSRRLSITACLIIGGAVFLLVPWSSHVRIPAILQAADLAQLYPPKASRIVRIETGANTHVEAGDPILTLEVPQIENEIEATRIKQDEVRLRLARAIADRKDRANLIVLKQELASLNARLAGLQRETGELIIRAPISGTILQMEDNLHKGRWIGKNVMLALVASGKNHVIKGYVEEDNLHRIASNASGRFIPDDLTRRTIPVSVSSIAQAGARFIEFAELTSLNGGRIPVSTEEKQYMIPLSAQYLVDLEPVILDIPPNQVIRGIVQLKGVPQSVVGRIWRQVAKVIVRESGF